MRETEVPSYFWSGLMGSMGGALSQLFNKSRPKIQEAIANGAAAAPAAANQAGGMICPDPSAHAQPSAPASNPMVEELPTPGGNPMEEPDAPPQSAEEAAIVDQTAEQIKDDIATGSLGGGFQKAFQNILGIPGGGGRFFGPPTVFLPGREEMRSGYTNPISPISPFSGGGFFSRRPSFGRGLPDLLGMGTRTTSRMVPRGLLGRGVSGLFGRMF